MAEINMARTEIIIGVSFHQSIKSPQFCYFNQVYQKTK